MPALNRHRRFLEDKKNFFDPICNFQCDPERNPRGICFANCAATCPSFCHITDWSAPPSSSPSPAFSPYSQKPPPLPKHPHLSFPIKISLIFLVATFSYTIYKFFTVWYRSRRRHRTQPPSSPENQETVDYDALDHHIWYIRTAGLQLSEINAITIVKYSKGDGVVLGTDCTVCLSEFDVDETLRLLPNCKHAFHISCIDTWLRSHTNCPLCRAGIVDNTVHPPLPEPNSDVLGNPGETNLHVSGIEGVDREEASGSSVLTNGETDEEHLNGNSEFLLRSEDLAASNDRGIGFQSRDGGSEIELVKIEHRTDENTTKIGG